MRNWYILREEAVSGPFDLDDLERMAKSGELLADAPATCDEFRFWYRARDVTGLDFPTSDPGAASPPASGPEPLPISIPVPLPPEMQPSLTESPPSLDTATRAPASPPAEETAPPESAQPSASASARAAQPRSAKTPDFMEVDGLEVQYSDPVDGSTEIAFRPQLVIEWKSVAAWGALVLAVAVVVAIVIWRLHGSH